MNDLASLIDWSRAQFALTAMYHWLFVPLTLGLSVIVAIMETIYFKTHDVKWLATTKFWMTLLYTVGFYRCRCSWSLCRHKSHTSHTQQLHNAVVAARCATR